MGHICSTKSKTNPTLGNVLLNLGPCAAAYFFCSEIPKKPHMHEYQTFFTFCHSIFIVFMRLLLCKAHVAYACLAT